jgi:hypothetical protein
VQWDPHVREIAVFRANTRMGVPGVTHWLRPASKLEVRKSGCGRQAGSYRFLGLHEAGAAEVPPKRLPGWLFKMVFIMAIVPRSEPERPGAGTKKVGKLS